MGGRISPMLLLFVFSCGVDCISLTTPRPSGHISRPAKEGVSHICERYL